MKVMEIRELKAHISEAIQEVSEGETIDVTNHGKVIARIVPPYYTPNQQEVQSALDSMRILAAEIGKYAPAGLSAEDVIDEVRR